MSSNAPLRDDLMALTVEDLEALCSRGAVKRAVGELEDNSVECLEVNHEGGSLIFIWSDGVTCKFVDNQTVHKALCTCDATTICRHLVRSVFFYQQQNAASRSVQAPWSPGAISDEALATHCGAATLKKARQMYDSGETVELIVSTKPVARLFGHAHSVRYTLEGDIRYAGCDCRDQAPCVHAVLGVWAFRLMTPDKVWATVNTASSQAVDGVTCDALEKSVGLLLYYGLNSDSSEVARQIKRAENCLGDASYPYLLEILHEIWQDRERARVTDSLFSPVDFVALIAELLCRVDCARAQKGEIPTTILTGDKHNKPGDINKANLLGLGSQAVETLNTVQIISYFQDQLTGNLLTMLKEHKIDKDQQRVNYAKLADKAFFKAYSLGKVGLSHVIANGGKLTSSRIYQPSRGAVSVNPQSFQWENIRHPLLAENFAELRGRLESEYPWYLSSRQKGKSLKVVKLSGHGDTSFDIREQVLLSLLQDENDNKALLALSFRKLAESGFERLASALNDPLAKIVFVSGIWYLSGDRLQVEPVAVVFEKEGRRFAVQPDVDGPEQGCEEGCEEGFAHNLVAREVAEPLRLAREVMRELGGLFKIGLIAVKSNDLKFFHLALQQAKEQGSLLLHNAIADFIGTLEKDEPEQAEIVPAALNLCVVSFILEQEYW